MDHRAAQMAEALDLARRALVILDGVDAHRPAIYLQEAINELTGIRQPGTIEEAKAMWDMPEVQSLCRRLFGEEPPPFDWHPA